MTNFSVRAYRETDFVFVHEQIAREKWGLTRKQVESMISYERRGCFIVEIDGKRAGQIFSICFGTFGWIALLIVEPKFRGKGVARILLKKATDYLTNCGATTLGLEARYTVAELYRKFGFVDSYEIKRLIGSDIDFSKENPLMVESLESQMVDAVARFDSKYFWGSRAKVIANLQNNFPSQCFFVRKKSEIAGYIMCSETDDGYRIGPWVCEPADSEVAQTLLLKCLSSLGRDRKISVSVPAANKNAIDCLHGVGFEEYMTSLHMFRGERLQKNRLNSIFAFAGPEKG
jgi:ribosomal protein S18 acetylase RimI-like enzyme